MHQVKKAPASRRGFFYVPGMEYKKSLSYHGEASMAITFCINRLLLQKCVSHFTH
jgi:hypothetical protein